MTGNQPVRDRVCNMLSEPSSFVDCNLVSSTGFTALHRTHQWSLWHSILTARGFSPCFGEWWGARALGVGEPCSVPVSSPDHATALLFYAGAEVELSQLETALNASRSHARRPFRATEVHAMYLSVRRDPPAQVDSLATSISASVKSIDEEECAVVLASTPAWNPELPVLHGLTPVAVVHLDSDKLWLQSCQGIEVGDELRQCTSVGRLEDLFRAFED